MTRAKISTIQGLQGSSKAFWIGRQRLTHSKILVICKNQSRTEELFGDICFFEPGASTLLLPEWDTLPLEPVSPQIEITAQRVSALRASQTLQSYVAVASVPALMQKVLNFETLERQSFSLKSGQEVNRDFLISKFLAAGFQGVSLVESTGEIAIRGVVIDFLPVSYSKGVRIELNASRIAHIKLFELESQRSLTNLESIVVEPVLERLDISKHGRSSYYSDELIENIRKRAKELELPPSESARLIESVCEGLLIPEIDLVFLSAWNQLVSTFSYFSDCTLIFDDHMACEQSLDYYWELINERALRIDSAHIFPSPEKLYLTPTDFSRAAAQHTQIYLDSLELLDTIPSTVEKLTIPTKSNIILTTKLETKIGTGKALSALKRYVESLRKHEYSIAFVAGSESRGKRLRQWLLSYGYDAHQIDLDTSTWLNSRLKHPIIIMLGNLSAGFQLESEKIAFVSENEIFPERSHRRKRSQTTNIKRLMSAISQLKHGDYVVHVDYGVGIYRGLKHMLLEGVASDLLQIDYADSKLFLPIQNIARIQKFVAAEGKAPAIDKLASKRWQNTKRKVRESVATLAGDLIKLYATRAVIKGWRYDPSSALDEEFADTFPWDETPDQLKAINDTLKDLAKDRPMDRLICGDVGFGKTEVAVRAAYKCIQHARQVAVLVPTTLLAEQHRQSFSRRFADYPVKIESLSRFNPPPKNKTVLAELKTGKVDLVIGTHRLLQKDVHFKELGLVIIDEEHRFGVKQKEKLKQLKKQVDVLTLSATPIPRTLHLSLLGIRDISIINSPPNDRMLIRTYVASSEEGLIRDAILREIQRGGQCFFVHNRVQSIASFAGALAKLVPEAKFKFAHGQMAEHELEKIMASFLKREIDVLVSTSIIESGLDIPNANTILIDRADAMGLAQLYQLRGRVGRSTRQAYCYFLIPKSKRISADAQERLKALQALDDLGLGFNLAVRDLEIRGAGNLLGKEQSGNVLLVGFELFTKILKEAIANLKGEELEIEEQVDPEVRLNFESYIPEWYIPDISERLVLYQRLSSLADCRETDEIANEIEDRFGHLPAEAQNYLELMRIRTLLKHYGVERAEVRQEKASLSFGARNLVDTEKVKLLVEANPQAFKVTKQGTLSFSVDPQAAAEISSVYGIIERVLLGITAEAGR